MLFCCCLVVDSGARLCSNRCLCDLGALFILCLMCGFAVCSCLSVVAVVLCVLLAACDVYKCCCSVSCGSCCCYCLLLVVAKLVIAVVVGS